MKKKKENRKRNSISLIAWQDRQKAENLCCPLPFAVCRLSFIAHRLSDHKAAQISDFRLQILRFNAYERHVKFNLTPKIDADDATCNHRDAKRRVATCWVCECTKDPNKVQLARFMIIPVMHK